ncbi:MAG TPA: prepilin-type N-terminal cleavage/methylation domain-containing protein [Candidatus Acidoferrum sp.]|nr:prepilin-type N-terminal cleavage/methylation domain-containing protein [Candidatus Acidoferrum sp.]
MKARAQVKLQRGFTLIELLVALGIFLLVIGAAFTLLSTSQQRYRTESQVLSSFQEARLGMDEMVRDINDAGFPPPSFANVDPTKVTAAPFGWQPGYTVPNPCQIGINCFTPGDFDIIIETEPNPVDPSCFPNCQVQWIRYQLAGPNGTTLMRGAVYKQVAHDPAVDTSAVLVPFVENVVNNSPNFQIGQFQLSAAYPALFPGGNPVPIFQYTCDTPSVSPPPSPLPLCVNALGDNSPLNIRDVAITLIVADPSPDAATGRPRLVQLEGRGRRINPNQ